MLHQLRHFLVHFFKSYHLHGIHSPFIFSFQHDCLYGNNERKIKDEVLRFRESFKNNHTILTIEDHGAGSKRLHDSKRKVSDILKSNCTTLKRSLLLNRICNYFEVNNALELGTSLGIGTHTMALSSATVTSVEASQSIYEFTSRNLDSFSNVNLVNKTFIDFFKEHRLENTKYDLIFLDGHHDGQATLGYFEQLLPFCHNDTVIILDDIYWSSSMTSAWKKLQQHPAVSASIDTFYWGFLFLRKEQHQEQFHINIHHL